jgi:hypothetical protein
MIKKNASQTHYVYDEKNTNIKRFMTSKDVRSGGSATKNTEVGPV